MIENLIGSRWKEKNHNFIYEVFKIYGEGKNGDVGVGVYLIGKDGERIVKSFRNLKDLMEEHDRLI